MASKPESRMTRRAGTGRGEKQKKESVGSPPRRGDRGNAKKKVAQCRGAEAATIAAEAPTTCRPGDSSGVDLSERETTFNGRERGPAHAIAKPVDEIAAIQGFLIDVDLKLLDPDVLGESALASAEQLYEKHVRHWLDRDKVLSKAEVRDTGGGVHVLLWLDEPVVCAAGQQRHWDAVARGLHDALPGDPKLGGIIAMTRPVGALNLKYDPPREVRLLREGKPVTQKEVLDLIDRLATAPSRLWMNLVTGANRVSPCPLCRREGTSLGIAGAWRLRCYECNTVDAAALVYRCYQPDFLTRLKEDHHG